MGKDGVECPLWRQGRLRVYAHRVLAVFFYFRRFGRGIPGTPIRKLWLNRQGLWAKKIRSKPQTIYSEVP